MKVVQAKVVKGEVVVDATLLGQEAKAILLLPDEKDGDLELTAELEADLLQWAEGRSLGHARGADSGTAAVLVEKEDARLAPGAAAVELGVLDPEPLGPRPAPHLHAEQSTTRRGTSRLTRDLGLLGVGVVLTSALFVAGAWLLVGQAKEDPAVARPRSRFSPGQLDYTRRGRWFVAPNHIDPPPADKKAGRRKKRSGVVTHDAQKAHPGLNFYCSGHGPEALLIDMQGKQLHRWRYRFGTAFPHLADSRADSIHHWRRAYLYPDGNVLAIYEGMGIIKVDKNSKLIWANDMFAHHDADIGPDGTIYALSRDSHVVPSVHPSRSIFEDHVSFLDGKTGRELRRISLLEALRSSPFAEIFTRSPVKAGDIFQTNSIELLSEDNPAAGPEFAAGNLLLSAQTLAAIMILDPKSEKIVWAHQGDFRGQHDFHLLAGKTVLLLDNHSVPGRSRLLAIDPRSEKTTVIFAGSKEQPFFTRGDGTAKRLPNGNHLIAETDSGRSFEIDTSGRIVWDFINPRRAGNRRELIAAVFDMFRVPNESVQAWLKPRREPKRR